MKYPRLVYVHGDIKIYILTPQIYRLDIADNQHVIGNADIVKHCFNQIINKGGLCSNKTK